MHVRTDRLRTRDPTESETRAGWRCKLRLKLHRSTPRGFGRKEHFMRQLLLMCPRPDSTQSTRGPDSYLFFSPHQTQLSAPQPESSRLGALGARPRSFDHSDRDASSPPTRICSARGARGPDDYLLYKTMGSHSRADAHDAGPTSQFKRPLIREDLNVIQHQYQETDNTFITSDGTSPYNSTR